GAAARCGGARHRREATERGASPADADVIPVWGEVARDVPPLTRPGPDDWERLDVASVGSHVSGVRDLSTSRGADMWTGVVEAGRASARVDNRVGQLDELKVRRRVRFVAQ